MTNSPKPEAGEVLFRNAVKSGPACYVKVTIADIAAAGYVPAASLTAAQERVAGLESELTQAKARADIESASRAAWGERCRDYEQQVASLQSKLAAEREGRAHLEQAAELLRSLYRRTYHVELPALIKTDLIAWYEADRASTPAPPSEGPASPVREALTQAEVEALPDGTPIVVTWSGGNGPHSYTLRQRAGGHPAAYDGPTFVGWLDYCGPSPQTQVALRSQPTPTEEAKAVVDAFVAERKEQLSRAYDSPLTQEANGYPPVAPAAEGELCNCMWPPAPRGRNHGVRCPAYRFSDDPEPPPASPPARVSRIESPMCQYRKCQNLSEKDGLCYDHQPQRRPSPVGDAGGENDDQDMVLEGLIRETLRNMPASAPLGSEAYGRVVASWREAMQGHAARVLSEAMSRGASRGEEIVRCPNGHEVGAYYKPESDNFYCNTCRTGMGDAYYKQRRDRPPQPPPVPSLAEPPSRGELVEALETSGNEAMKWLARELKGLGK